MHKSAGYKSSGYLTHHRNTIGIYAHRVLLYFCMTFHRITWNLRMDDLVLQPRSWYVRRGRKDSLYLILLLDYSCESSCSKNTGDSSQFNRSCWGIINTLFPNKWSCTFFIAWLCLTMLAAIDLFKLTHINRYINAQANSSSFTFSWATPEFQRLLISTLQLSSRPIETLNNIAVSWVAFCLLLINLPVFIYSIFR